MEGFEPQQRHYHDSQNNLETSVNFAIIEHDILQLGNTLPDSDSVMLVKHFVSRKYQSVNVDENSMLLILAGNALA